MLLQGGRKREKTQTNVILTANFVVYRVKDMAFLTSTNKKYYVVIELQRLLVLAT